jgi:hypothetical protein
MGNVRADSCRYAFEGKYVAAKGRLRPETRLPLTVVGSAIMPVRINHYLVVYVADVSDLPILVRLDSEQITLDQPSLGSISIRSLYRLRERPSYLFFSVFADIPDLYALFQLPTPSIPPIRSLRTRFKRLCQINDGSCDAYCFCTYVP